MTEPTGILSTPKALLRDLIASLPAFQAWCGVSTAEAAKEKILYSLLHDADLRNLRPFVVIKFMRFSMTKIAGGGQNMLWPQSPVLRAYFEDNDRAAPEIRDGSIQASLITEGDTIFENLMSAVIEGLAAAAAVDDNLAINMIEIEEPLGRNPPATWPAEGPCIFQSLLIGYE